MKMHQNKKLGEFHSAAKAAIYFGASLFLILVLLSNSITAVLKTIWRDVGNNWAVGWEYLENNLSPFQLYLLGFLVLPMALYWIYGAIFMYFDLQEGPTLLSRYKIQPEKNEPVDREKLWKCISVVLFNQVVVSSAVALTLYYPFHWRGCSLNLPLPTFNTFLFQMGMFILVEEALFYYSHRLLHTPFFYGWIHKKHHQWTAPVGISAVYCHPAEHIFSNLLPVLCGPFLLGAHLAVMTAWFCMAIMNTIHVHSGYHLPFLPSPQSHDWHHLRFNENFGVIGFLDYVHGTDTAFRQSAQFQRHKMYFSLDDYFARLPKSSERAAK
jgi:methylsterol monooxygenase